MLDAASLDALDAAQLRVLIRSQQQELATRQLKIDKLTLELAMYRRWRFAARSEKFSAEQAQLFEESAEADLAALQTQLQQLKPAAPPVDKAQPRRQPLPAHLPRREIYHEPQNTTCACGCALRRIGEDIAEKLDYRPGISASSVTSVANGCARSARS